MSERRPTDHNKVDRADELRDLVLEHITEDLEHHIAELQHARQLRWEGLGFRGEPTANPGFLFVCTQCGHYASLGTWQRRNDWSGEIESGPRLSCRNENCGQQEEYV